MNSKNILIIIFFLLESFNINIYAAEKLKKNDPTAFENLVQAIKMRQNQTALNLLNNGELIPDLNEKYKGNTLLHIAVIARNFDIVKSLVEEHNKVNINRESDAKATPLDMAIDGDSKHPNSKYKQIIDYLKKNGALTSEKTKMQQAIDIYVQQQQQIEKLNLEEKFPELFSNLDEKYKPALSLITKENMHDPNEPLAQAAQRRNSDITVYMQYLRWQAIAKAEGIEYSLGDSNVLWFGLNDIMQPTPAKELYRALSSEADVRTRKDKSLARSNPAAKTLVKQYKIHLMPKENDIEKILIKLFKAFKTDNALLKIASTKILLALESNLKEVGAPRIVLYITGKNQAQLVLNKIYDLFKDDAGSNRAPKFNEKVTSLIYFAQGDRDFKSSYNSFFEQPDLIYFKKGLTKDDKGQDEDYYLENPGTPRRVVFEAKEYLAHIGKLEKAYPELFSNLDNKYKKEAFNLILNWKLPEESYSDAVVAYAKSLDFDPLDKKFIKLWQWQAKARGEGLQTFYCEETLWIFKNKSDFDAIDFIQNIDGHFSTYNKSTFEPTVKYYEFALMPKIENLEKILVLLFQSLSTISVLSDNITIMAVSLKDEIELTIHEEYLDDEPAFEYPQIILYTSKGTHEAQLVLDKIYEIFKNYEGSGRIPNCFKAVPTDNKPSLIYFAQGLLPIRKNPIYSKLFESPERIYFKEDITKQKENYHLNNPGKKD
jgi:hypothetical protein